MYKKILIPLDGSKTAEAVLPLARSWSSKLKLPVELIAVVDTAELARSLSTIDRFYMNSLVDEETRRCSEYLAKAAKDFFPDGCKSRLEEGSAANIIIEAAAADKGTLIMMATHGRSGINRWLLGSVAEKVLRGTSNPLLLIRGPRETPTDGHAVVSSIVVPLDGSDLAETVLPSVIDLAKKLDLEVILLRAYNIPFGFYDVGGGFAIDLDRLLAQTEADVQRYLEEKSNMLKKAGLVNVTIASRQGYGADEIINYAGNASGRLIVMCSHGRSGVRRWALGSVAEKVLRHGKNPVLIFRASV
jgi:nucleotide-binding universal stress UspA family protein